MEQESWKPLGEDASPQAKGKRLESLMNLSKEILDKERRIPMHFNDFLHLANTRPGFAFRDIFQLFHDMVFYYVPQPSDEYPLTKDSIGFVKYDTSNLFEKDCDDMFFADRLFANRFMNLARAFRKGVQNNRIYFFEGPPGSGKSLFLNNLLQKFEQYTRTEEGAMFKVHWRLDIERLGGFHKFEKELGKVLGDTASTSLLEQFPYSRFSPGRIPNKTLNFSCPSHDHPILLVPKPYRKRFLEDLIEDRAFKEMLFYSKEYEWVLKEIPCSICTSLYTSLLNILGDPMEVFSMVHVQNFRFNRQFGEGITVFNPGDPPHDVPLKNEVMQSMLADLLKTEEVAVIHSNLAKTNNGVYALMDIKEHNVTRLRKLHGIISDGVHKVELVEERVKSLFMALVNPEDRKHFEDIKSFQDRIITVNVPYVLDYNTEVLIYKNKFGNNIPSHFLPGVLENFAKIIISSRLSLTSPTVRRWLKNPGIYSKYLDRNYLLLKMEMYTGRIPDWLTEEDVKRCDQEVRKSIIAESEEEGKKGFSGRMSLNIFNDFYALYSKRGMVNMAMLEEFFNEANHKDIPAGFIESIVNLYDYNVLQQVKEAIYYYNEDQIGRDIVNYLFAINFDLGETKQCPYTKDEIDVTEEFFRNFEVVYLGTITTLHQRKAFRDDQLQEYITGTLTREMMIEGKDIRQTRQFQGLFDKYTRNLKKNALAPYSDNVNFRRAIQDYHEKNFHSYDDRTKRDVRQLVANLQIKFRYTEDGARHVALYVLDKRLASKF